MPRRSTRPTRPAARPALRPWAAVLLLGACGGGGLQSAGTGGNDGSPPTVGTVNDGPGEDIDAQASVTTIHANWQGFRDAEGPIAAYLWAIGTTPGGTDLQDWTDVGTATAASNGGLGLTVGQTCHASVRARDLAGNLSPIATSDGVRIDGGGGAVGLARSLSQWGITWTFAEAHPVGRFCNGDWWVLGPVDVVSITPATTVVDGGRVVHGSMRNPLPAHEHGYDNTLYGDTPGAPQNRYRPDLNVAIGVSVLRPLRLMPGSSLVSTVSQMVADPVSLSQLATAAVLTVLGGEPPGDAFRPPYTGHDRTVRFTEAMLEHGALGRLAPSAGAPGPAALAPLFERVWLDHCPGWISRFLHPVQNMKDYGRDFTADVGSAALVLNMDFPAAQKRDLLVRLVQLGIDHWGNVQHGCTWPGEGGQGSGRKFPILFAGRLLGDAAMLGVGHSHPSGYFGPGDPRNAAVFGEDCQTFVVAETSAGVFNWGHGGYTAGHRGLPEWGNYHAQAPANDRAGWLADPYRRCCTANAWVGQCLTARIMGLQAAWNHPPFFAYMDRYLQTEGQGTWTRAWQDWHGTAWNLYRPQS